MIGNILLTLGLLIYPSIASAEPGGEQMLETKTLTVRLFISAAAYAGDTPTGFELVWVPKSLLKDCAGRSLKDCQDLDHQRWVDRPAAPKKTANKPETPNRVLTSWVSTAYTAPGSKAVAEAIRKTFKKPKEFKKGERTQEIRFSTLESARSVQAEVVWELWTNGEGFHLKKVLKH